MDGLGELQDLVGQLEQLLVLLLFFLDGLPLVVGQDLAFLVGAVLADHDEGRQEDGLQRHDHGQQPVGVVLDAEDDPGREPDDVEVDEQHRAGEAGDLVGDAVLQALAALFGVLQQRRVDGDGKRSCAHASSFLLWCPRWARPAQDAGVEGRDQLEVDYRGGGPSLPVGPASTAVMTRTIPTMVRGPQQRPSAASRTREVWPVVGCSRLMTATTMVRRSGDRRRTIAGTVRAG